MADLFSGAASGAAAGSVIPGLGTLIGGGIGALGGLFGGLLGGGTQTQTNTKNIAPAGADETNYLNSVNSQFGALGNTFNSQNYDQFNGQVGSANQSYLDILKNLSQTGGVPNAGQVGQANSLYQQLYAPQQTQLNQSFLNAKYGAQQQAASMGRQTNDPVLQAKLLTGQSQQQQLLNSQITSGAAGYAQSLPGMQAQYAGQAAGAVNQLAQNAAQNRMTLLGLGNQLQQQQQGFRLNAASQTQTGQTSGSLGQGIGGFFGGAGSGMKGGSLVGGIFGNQGDQATFNNFQQQSQNQGNQQQQRGQQQNYPSLGVNTNLGF